MATKTSNRAERLFLICLGPPTPTSPFHTWYSSPTALLFPFCIFWISIGQADRPAVHLIKLPLGQVTPKLSSHFYKSSRRKTPPTSSGRSHGVIWTTDTKDGALLARAFALGGFRWPGHRCASSFTMAKYNVNL